MSLIKRKIKSKQNKMLNFHQNKNNYFYWNFYSSILFILFINNVASHMHNCTGVKCPPMSEIECPEDSHVREIHVESNLLLESDDDEIIEEIFVHCCVTQKCLCRTCNIPTCENSTLVLVELVPETQTPGKCCGQYQCSIEPNCTETLNTNGRWFADCQKCQCVNGARICHRECDESIIQSPTKTCFSNHLNRFYEDGDVWKDDECTHCECHLGEKKCQTSFCRQLNCNRIVKIPGECCPICEPGYEFGIRSNETKFDLLTTLSPEISSTTTSTSTTSTTEQITSTTSTSTSQTEENTIPPTTLPSQSSTTTSSNYTIKNFKIYIAPRISDTLTSSTTKEPIILPEILPCSTRSPVITYTVPNSDVILQPPPPPQYCAFYAIIAVLMFLLCLFVVLYILERKGRKERRSYQTVPSTDDNSNKILHCKLRPIEQA